MKPFPECWEKYGQLVPGPSPLFDVEGRHFKNHPGEDLGTSTVAHHAGNKLIMCKCMINILHWLLVHWSTLLLHAYICIQIWRHNRQLRTVRWGAFMDKMQCPVRLILDKATISNFWKFVYHFNFVFFFFLAYCHLIAMVMIKTFVDLFWWFVEQAVSGSTDYVITPQTCSSPLVSLQPALVFRMESFASTRNFFFWPIRRDVSTS